MIYSLSLRMEQLDQSSNENSRKPLYQVIGSRLLQTHVLYCVVNTILEY